MNIGILFATVNCTIKADCGWSSNVNEHRKPVVSETIRRRRLFGGVRSFTVFGGGRSHGRSISLPESMPFSILKFTFSTLFVQGLFFIYTLHLFVLFIFYFYYFFILYYFGAVFCILFLWYSFSTRWRNRVFSCDNPNPFVIDHNFINCFAAIPGIFLQ